MKIDHRIMDETFVALEAPFLPSAFCSPQRIDCHFVIPLQESLRPLQICRNGRVLRQWDSVGIWWTEQNRPAAQQVLYKGELKRFFIRVYHL